MNLRGRSFLTLLDYSPEEIRYLLDLSHALKREKRERVFPERLKHRNIVLIFDKTSTRTRCAFEVAALDEGVPLTLIGEAPATVTLIGIIPADLGLGLELSPEAAVAVGQAVEYLVAELRGLGYAVVALSSSTGMEATSSREIY